jgi:hypothetical protein
LLRFFFAVGKRNEVPPRTVANSAKENSQKRTRETPKSSHPAPTPDRQIQTPRISKAPRKNLIKNRQSISKRAKRPLAIVKIRQQPPRAKTSSRRKACRRQKNQDRKIRFISRSSTYASRINATTAGSRS